MKNLDIYKSRVFDGKTFLVHHVYNTENANEDSTGVWPVFGDLNDQQILDYGRLMVAPEIQINLRIVKN